MIYLIKNKAYSKIYDINQQNFIKFNLIYLLFYHISHCFDDQLYANPIANNSHIARHRWKIKYINDHNDLYLIFLSTKQNTCINIKITKVSHANTAL